MPSVRPRTIMKVKRPVKDKRLSRRIELESKEAMIEPKVEVITENVLVPVTKTIFTGKKFDRTTYRSKRAVQLVRLCRSNDNNNVTRALLKRPTNNIPVRETRETCANRLIPGEQTEDRRNNPENRTISKQIWFPVINGHFERFDRRSKMPRHKRMESKSESKSLPFPCPISAVRAASIVAVTRSVDVSSCKGRKEKHEKADKQTSKIVSRNKEISFESKEGGKLVDDRSSANAAMLNFDDSDDSDDFDDFNDFDNIVNSMESSLCYRDTSDLSIRSRNSICMVPIATSTRPSTTIRCCDSALTKIGLTVNLKGSTLSGGYVADRGQQESSRYSVELSTPKRDAIFETLSSRSHQKIPGSKLSVRDPAAFSRDATDRTTFTFLVEESAVPENGHSCKIKYSWQAIGRGSQTSRALLENFIEANGLDGEETIHQCGIKYSWQIIGIGTQTSKRDLTVAIAERDAIATRLLAKVLDKGSRRSDVTNAHTPAPATIYRNGKRFILLNNQCTQTISHKENQTNFLEIYENYH